MKGGGDEFAPVDQQRIVMVDERQIAGKAIGIGEMLFADPPRHCHRGYFPVALKAIEPFVERRVRLRFARQQEMGFQRQNLLAKRLVAVKAR